MPHRLPARVVVCCFEAVLSFEIWGGGASTRLGGGEHLALPASCSIAYLAALKQGAEGSGPCAPCTQLKQTALWWSSLGFNKLLDRVHDTSKGPLNLIWGAFAPALSSDISGAYVYVYVQGEESLP